MAYQRCKSQSAGRIAVRAAVFATVAFYALPTIASTIPKKSCPSVERATLTVATDALITTPVSHDVSAIRPEESVATEISARTLKPNLLAPRAEAAIRQAFDDGKSKLRINSNNDIDIKLIETVLNAPVVETETDARIEAEGDRQAEIESGMKTSLPGIAEDELSRFKKLMFRRDI